MVLVISVSTVFALLLARVNKNEPFEMVEVAVGIAVWRHLSRFGPGQGAIFLKASLIASSQLLLSASLDSSSKREFAPS